MFSARDLTVKESLLRGEKLTIDKAVSMVRAAETSREQMKVMSPKEKCNSVNQIRYFNNQEKNPTARRLEHFVLNLI